MPDPAIPDLVASGGLVGLVYVIWQVAYRVWIEEALAERRRRKGDAEHEAKNRTRDAIRQLTEDSRRTLDRHEQIVETLRSLAEAQRSTLKELDEFRRETRMTLERLERGAA